MSSSSGVQIGQIIERRCQYCRKITQQEVLGITTMTVRGPVYKTKCKVCGRINTTE
ncbi:MAG: hypothetical protein QXO15_04495 [Nitrososphaerota archaeon]